MLRLSFYIYIYIVISDYVQSLRVCRECGLLGNIMQQAATEGQGSLIRGLSTEFDDTAKAAYDREMPDEVLSQMVELAPTTFNPAQKVRFMELLSARMGK